MVFVVSNLMMTRRLNVRLGRMSFNLGCNYLLMLALVPLWTAIPMQAKTLDNGHELARAMAERDEGKFLRQKLTMTMTTHRGQVRSREAEYVRANYAHQRQTLIRFEAPQRIRGSSFLTHEHQVEGKQDDQWLYLPVLRKVRRVSASDRGDHFFGSDFTYEDVKAATKFSLYDYNFRLLSAADAPDLESSITIEEQMGKMQIMEAIPKSANIARELGYGRVIAWVDSERLIPLRVRYWDVGGEPLKRVTIGELSLTKGIWTPRYIEARNDKSGHRSEFRFSDIRYPDSVSADRFSPGQMADSQ